MQQDGVPIEYDEVDDDFYILEEDVDLFDWSGGLG